MSNVAAARIFLRNIGHKNVALHLQRDIYTSKTDTQKKNIFTEKYDFIDPTCMNGVC